MLDRVLARWPLKLLALGLAFAIWLSVTAEKRIPRDFRVAVDIPRVAADLVRTELSDSTVSVRVRGPESVINEVSATDLTLRIDPSEMGPGVHEIPLMEHLRGVPRNAEVDWIDPSMITATFDRRLRRSLPVIPSFLGAPAEGYHLYGYTVLPERVEIAGPETEVAQMESVATDPIPLDGREAPFRARVGIIALGPGIDVLSASRRLEIRADVAEAPLRADFPKVPVVPSAQVLDVAFQPGEVDVTLSAPPELLARIRPEQVQAVADVSALAVDERSRLPITVEIRDLPAPDRARVKVESLSHTTVQIRPSNRGSR